MRGTPKSQEQLSDEEICEGIFTGSEWHENCFYQRYRPITARFLGRIAKQSAYEIADLVHEAMIIVLIRLRDHHLDDPTQLKSFVLGVARNIWRDEVRRASRRSNLLNYYGFETQEAPQDPAEIAQQDEARTLIQQSVKKLNVERDRELLERHYFRHEDKIGICKSLDLCESNYARVHFRARRRLRRVLENEPALQAL